MNQKENKKIIIFQRGSVAAFALILMFILAVATIGIITTASLERKSSISTGSSTTAFQVAESGMEKTLQYFKDNFDKKLSDAGSCAAGTGIVTYDPYTTIRFRSNDETYITDCEELISNVNIIKSIGTTKQETRVIEEVVFLAASKLLLHLNGKNFDGDFEDSSYYYEKNDPIEINGDVSVSTDILRFGGGSAEFDGTGYLSIPDSDDWDLGTKNFTLDWWARPESLTANNTYLEIGSWPDSVLIRQDSANTLGVYIMGGSGYTYSFAPSIGDWYHIAIVRKNDDLRVFVNGDQVGADQDISSKNIQVSDEMRVGSSVYASGQVFYGYIDELRISKGVARWWDSPFDYPTAEYWPD
ncbi:MAG: hypothetical protein COS71_03665 [Candidatus Moranbacteria bacterium CG06_land_8_20_14_3_00_40_12]|nr:MAG: hypothetical protein COX31_00825 [Candidatus Moranbacteria bacterium CG23_combo_of_CG06-09_8_20_14_all_40_16]PIU80363.1 MAG: hypothetical protein COS71_03665 [Candidatus Moranbacteria bacterium CG06_land_8_20_14_3_00_40_12]